ncbi:MAG TPA: Na+/H+ antiporter NhaA [Microscillaceae bacterium]|nr:Na+/H+ antiporter NhaA [Microscillaceae bacterium]
MKKKHLSKDSITGFLLLFATFVALVWANSPWAESYKHFWETELMLEVGSFKLSESLHHWVNDGLMALFFFHVGLEIKAELVGGELNTFRKSILPVAAAFGGMLVPVLIFLLVNLGADTANGWGIPMATDIAFAVVLLAAFKSKVPSGLVVFLTALAVVDDLGSILVIAIFYSSGTDLMVLSVGLIGFVVLLLGNKLGIRKSWFYILIGVAGLWYFFLKSGVHATIAGVLIALAVPARTRINGKVFAKDAQKLLDDFSQTCESGTKLLTPQQADLLEDLRQEVLDAETPLQHWSRVLEPVINFIVLPLFALANAGFALSGESFEVLMAPVGIGIFLALWVGKPLGVFASTYLLVKLKVAELPKGANWTQLWGIAALAGIGFTVSLFISELAFKKEAIIEGSKLSILLASVIAALTGAFLLSRLPKRE